MGPVIDKAAYDRVLGYIELGKQEGKLAFQGKIPQGDGYFIPPTIFTDVSPAARVAQEEIFGPVLCVFKANDLDEALAWANGTEYALTGGFFSRSPGNIERVKSALEGWQCLYQSWHHRRDGCAASVWRIQNVRRRHKGRRTRLSAEFSSASRRDRE